MERELASITRKVARAVAEGRSRLMRVAPAALVRYLGAPKVHGEELLKKDGIGIATGLAWTPTGGDVLFVEATAMKGKGRLTLTGSLGEVMKESAQAALSYARTRARQFGIRDDYFATHDLHVHVPEGAIPKDGPSAGITIAAAMLSVFTNRPVKRSLAMTGEITLRGNVLPIGGLKEKILAARRTGITTLVCPKLNQMELDEVPAHVKRGLDFHLVQDVDEVLKLALVPPLAQRGAGKPTREFVHRSRSRPVVV
jgi:ATP-dependent Lon protease